jgi:hypothetical protein
MNKRIKTLIGVGGIAAILAVATPKVLSPDALLLGPSDATYLERRGPPYEADQRTFTVRANDCFMSYFHDGEWRYHAYEPDSPAVSGVSNERQAELWKKFDRADTNKDGKISYSELFNSMMG